MQKKLDRPPWEASRAAQRGALDGPVETLLGAAV